MAKILPFILPAFLFMAACFGGKGHVVTYIALNMAATGEESAPAESRADDAATLTPIVLNDIKVHPLYNRSAIVTLNKDGSATFLADEEWAAMPGELMAYALKEALYAEGINLILPGENPPKEAKNINLFISDLSWQKEEECRLNLAFTIASESGFNYVKRYHEACPEGIKEAKDGALALGALVRGAIKTAAKELKSGLK